MHPKSHEKTSHNHMYDPLGPLTPPPPPDVFGSSRLKHSSSDSSDRSGVKNRLKKFIIRRPSMKTLQEKGLIQGSFPAQPQLATHP